MRTARDPDAVLVDELTAPPPVEDARKSLEYWAGRRRKLPLHRRAARREADEMTLRWQQRLEAAEQARFDASRPGRVLAALGLTRFWPSRPAVDKGALVVFGWMLVPRPIKMFLAAATAVLLAVLALTVAMLVLAIVQLF